jgi:hypothetical protein
VEERGQLPGGDGSLSPRHHSHSQRNTSVSRYHFFSVETRQTKDKTNYSPTTPSFAFVHARTHLRTGSILPLSLHSYLTVGDEPVRFSLTYNKLKMCRTVQAKMFRKMKINNIELRDFRLSPRSRRELRSSGLLRSE